MNEGAVAEKSRWYLCIDLKSFYASVECVDRGLDPLQCDLVVADKDRSKTTICLAVSPSLKAKGVRNRCRVFDIPEGIPYVMAKPRMRRYMEVSSQIYRTYLRYVSPCDVHVYSVDECFIDATPYLSLYGTDARGLARMLVDAVYRETGICATAGAGTNLFLAKVALDVGAKHAPDNIAVLDEEEFRRSLWFHRPLTDIWGIGPRIANRLKRFGVVDLAGVAAMHEETLYREFGANAEYLIDHAWGQEPCTLSQIQEYRPASHSLTNGQVLPCDYTFDEARTVVKEMVGETSLELVEKGLSAHGVSLFVSYGRDDAPEDAKDPGHTGSQRKLQAPTSSARRLLDCALSLYDATTRHDRPVRRICLGFTDLQPGTGSAPTLFDDGAWAFRELDVQRTVNRVRQRFGKNAVLPAISLQEKATSRERNLQIGGHSR